MPYLTRHLMQRLKTIPLLQNKTTIEKVPFFRDILSGNIKAVTLLNSQKPLTSCDWKAVRQDLLQVTHINKKNLDSIIVNICQESKNNDAIESYIKFLKDENLEINLYLAGMYVVKLASNNPITDSDKREILALYDYVRKKYPILNTELCINFISALCVTDRWEESAELLDMMMITDSYNPTSINTLIMTAFRNNKPEIGWKYLTFAAENNICIFSNVYISYLEYCLKEFKNRELLEKNIFKMFEYCMESEKLIHKNVLDDYLTVIQGLGYTYSDAKISHRGICQSCFKQLPPPKISAEEFKEMSKLFMERVIVGDNIYYNSTPKEFKEFLNFLERAKPYDIVIDGLNVDSGTNNFNTKGKRLAEVVEYFVNRKKRIVLLGRKHMLRWRCMSYIKHNTKMFLVENSSFDDPSILYATMHGGLDTCFLSADLMRQHKQKLPLDMQKLFKTWQLTHQYLYYREKNTIIYPVNFKTITQKCGNDWHVPYFLGNTEVAKDSYDSTINWMCLRSKSK